MAENLLEGLTEPTSNDNAVHKKLLEDCSYDQFLRGADNSDELSGITSSALGRGVYALAEGITEVPHGIFNAVEHDLQHPSELFGKAATGAAFGLGLRLLLPKTGAAKALVGTAMSYFFIRDAARPMINTWRDASMASTMDEVHKAAQKMGNGLGNFAVDSTIAMGAGALAEGATGLALNRTASGRQFEAWKDLQFNSPEKPLGRFFKWSERTADNISGSIAEKLLGREQTGPEIPFEKKLELIKEANKHAAIEVRDKAGALDRALETRKQYRSEDFTAKIDTLLAGDRPIEASVKDGETSAGQSADDTGAVRFARDGKPLAEELFFADGPDANRFRVVRLTEEGGAESAGSRGSDTQPSIDGKTAGTEGNGAGAGGDLTGEGGNPTAGGKSGEGGKSSEGARTDEGGKPTDGGNTKNREPADGTAADDGGKPTDGTSPPTDKPVPVGGSGDLTSDNVGKMAVAMRRSVGKVSKEDIAVAQVKEDMKGPILSTMRGGKPPLDPGHFSNNEMLAALSDQIHTADEVRQVGTFLDHFRTANQQLELAVNGASGGLPEILDLNQYSRSIHAQLLTALDNNGIPRSVLRGTNSPMFTIRDSDGAGPYTIPAIEGVSDAAVVTYPREYQGKTPSNPDRPSMVGVHTAGVYPHELGHDLIYGDLAKFPQQSREGWLNNDVVKKGMAAAKIEDTDIQVPGAPNGVMKKSEFFVQLLKAEANENTADMFGSSIDPNGGLSLAVLLGSLRKPGAGNPKGPGLLETRSMYGKEMIDEHMENTLGIEPHGIDRWRIKLAAETLRHLSNGHQGLLKYADGLDVMAGEMARPGTQYIWANMDEPGKFVAIPMKEWDAIIPTLVKAQFDTPLQSLNNKTLRDLAPNMAERFPRIEGLAQSMADAALRGQTTVAGFEKSNYRIEEVVSAGLSGWLKAIETNASSGGKRIPPIELMNRIDHINENLRAEYRNDMPEASVPGPKEPARISDVAAKPLGVVARATGRMARFQPHLRERVAGHAGKLTSYAGSSLLGPTLTATLEDLMEKKRIQDAILPAGIKHTELVK